MLLRTFRFLPLQLRQMRKHYASLGSICLLVGFHDAFYDASSSQASCSCSLIFFALLCTSKLSLHRRCHFALDAIDHFVIVYMLSTLHVPGMCYLIFLPVMHTRTAIQLLHRGSFSEHIAGCPSRLSGGPTRSVHANVLPSPVLTRAYSFRISSGRGGIAPPVQRGAAHLAQTPQLERQGGNRPL